MSLYTKETDSPRVVFDEYRFIHFWIRKTAVRPLPVRNLEYTQLDYLQGGTHEIKRLFLS